MNWSQIITGLLISAPAIAANNSMVLNGLNEISSAQQQTRSLIQSHLTPEDKERVRSIDQRLMSAITLLQNSLDNPGSPPPHSSPYEPPIDFTFELFHSDSCNGNQIGNVNLSTNCEAVFNDKSAAWAIKVNGQCLDIFDIAATKACELFKTADFTNGVKIFNNDRCSKDLIAIVNNSTNCQTLSQFPEAWAIEVNGVCTNITDLSAVEACEKFKP